jgi:hypothetical protein
MVEYVADHCTISGATISGVTYETMVEYVSSVFSTYSGVTYQTMVDYVNEHCTTISGYVTYSGMVDYVDSHCSTTSGGGATQEQLDIIYNHITMVSGRITCWEDFFMGLQTFDNLTFDYPTPSGTIDGTTYFDGGTYDG